MVDLSTSKTAMRTKSKTRKYIEPDAFHLARRKAGLTVRQAAVQLDVNERTIRNYENGAACIPYPSFRIMRLLAGYSLLGEQWEGWGFHQQKLWSPEGRSYEVHELRYIATYLQIARRALLDHSRGHYAPASQSTGKNVIPLMAVSAFNSEPSDATAPFGVKVRQVIP